MIITKIEQQKKNKSRYNLYMDGTFKTGVHEDVIVLLGLRVKMVVDEDFYEEILAKELYAKAKQDAVNFIAYKMRSEKEVVDKLKQLAYAPDIIDAVMTFLHEYQFLNDIQYAKAFIHDKITLSRQSRKRIRYDLAAKGVSASDIDMAFDALDIQILDAEFEHLLNHVQKKMRQYKDKERFSEYEIRQKTIQFLANKGYNIGEIKKAIAMIEEEFYG